MKYILMSKYVAGTAVTKSRAQAVEMIQAGEGIKIYEIEPDRPLIKWGVVFMKQDGAWDMRENINRIELNKLAAKRSTYRKMHVYPCEIDGQTTAQSYKWTDKMWDVLLAGLL